MNNRFLVVLAAIVIGFFGVLFFTKKDSGKTNTSTATGQTSNHTIGTGKVLLVEHGDFECPACGKFYPIVEQVKQKYKDKITFQFKHFPLVEIHQNALLAARAAESASMQNKFWEMYNTLYSNQSDWSKSSDPTPIFESYAKQLGLDVTKFSTDLKGEETNGIVQADLAEAKQKGLNSTPSFFINGKQLTDARDTVEYFGEQIDKAIAEQTKNGQ